jgi:hypothetical protein
MLFKAATVVFLPPFLFGRKTPSQTRTTNFVLYRDVRILNNIRSTIPRGDAVRLNNADGQIPLSVSVGHGAEAVLCPLHFTMFRIGPSIFGSFLQ